MIFEQTGGPPPPLTKRNRGELKAPVQQSPAASGLALANWYWKAVRQFVLESFAGLLTNLRRHAVTAGGDSPVSRLCTGRSRA